MIAALLSALLAASGPELSLVIEPAGDLSAGVRAAGVGRVLAAAVPLAGPANARLDVAGLDETRQAAQAQGLAFWPVLPLAGAHLDLPGEQWSVSADGARRLVGLPCYGYADARRKLVAVAERLLEMPGGGLFLLVDGPLSWPADREAALEYGFNAPVVEEYARRYGGDARQTAPDSLERMFFLRLKGEHLGAAVRQVAQAAHARGRRVGLAVRLAETDVRTAARSYLDVEGLVRDKTLDEAVLIGGAQYPLLRWKVQADPSPAVGLWADAEGPGPLGRALSEAMKNGSADTLILRLDRPWSAALAAEIPRTIAGWRAQREEQARFAAELSGGRLRRLARTAEKPKLDVATTHGVGQSFRLKQAARVEAVRLLLALRGAADQDIADLRLELREDRQGRPEGAVLGRATIARSGVLPEANYQWVAARLDRPLSLPAGRTYWIHVPDVKGYVWRFDRSDPYSDGQAWSRRYDYGAGDWLFEILGQEGP